jgi:CheY-like chemotaxis protein
MTDRILVVDDEPDMRMLLRMTLERSGFEVEEAGSGEEAVEASVDPTIDLMLLDMNLPGINGLEVVSAIRADGRSDLPVILLTAASDATLPERAEASGCKDVISKYVPSAELVETIRSALDEEEIPS